MERGHDEAHLWKCTPRELIGRVHFSEKRRNRNSGEQLALMANAAQGSEKAINRLIKQLHKDG